LVVTTACGSDVVCETVVDECVVVTCSAVDIKVDVIVDGLTTVGVLLGSNIDVIVCRRSTTLELVVGSDDDDAV